MTTENEKKSALSFYGNTRIPLSVDCYGCYFFNYECPGSVFSDECPTGQVEDMTASHVGYDILVDDRVAGNHLLLERIAGNDLQSQYYRNHIEGLREKIQKNKGVSSREQYVEALEATLKYYEIAVSFEEEIIKTIQLDYQTDETLAYKRKDPQLTEENSGLDTDGPDDIPF